MNTQQISYSSFVAGRTKPGDDIVQQLTSTKAELLHYALGVAGEAGEIVDVVKKHCIYGQALDVEHLVEELGDMEFYLEALRQKINTAREAVLFSNMEKLAKRYPTSYSDVDAAARADKYELLTEGLLQEGDEVSHEAHPDQWFKVQKAQFGWDITEVPAELRFRRPINN